LPLLIRRLHLWMPPLLYMAVIFYFSSQPKPLPELTTHVWDKGLHAVEYGALGILLWRAFAGENVKRVRAVVLAIVVACAYAASDEWHQAFVPLRSPDVMDWMADTIGSIVGAAVVAVRAPRSLPER
jgi:VanZ family protein